jgi:hypothetical protein
MQFFTRDAAIDYAQLTSIAFHYEIIGTTHWLARIVALPQLAEPSLAADVRDFLVAHAGDFLSAEEWPMEDDWASTPNQEASALPVQDEEGSQTTGEGKGSVGRPNRPIDYLTPVGALKDWTFHLADDDFFPSIPHGHWKARPQPKLDAYLGWVYDRAVQQKRVKREDIVALWNEDKFRVFARQAIDYYLTHYPDYTGWSVLNPRRLPRRRR